MWWVVLSHQKFKFPQMEPFDGTKDPVNHMEAYKTFMHLQTVPNEIMYKAFSATSKGSTRTWFSKL